MASIAARVEERNPQGTVLLARGHVVQAGEKAVLGAGVGEHLQIQRGRELQAPISTAGANPAGQPFGGVTGLKVAGVEMHGPPHTEERINRDLAFFQCQCHGTKAIAFLVHRCDGNLAAAERRAADHPHESLPRAARRGKQRQPVQGGAIFQRRRVVRRRREVGQVPGGALQEAHREPREAARSQPPLPVAVAEAVRVFQRLGGQRERGLRPHKRQRAGYRMPLAPVVVAAGGPPRRLGLVVHHPQDAALVPVAAGIEERHHPVLAHIVHGGDEAVLGANVGQHLNIQRGNHRQSPVADSRRAHAVAETLRLVAFLQVRRVEMNCPGRTQVQAHPPGANAGIVHRIDVRVAVGVAPVHDTHEALPAAAGRREVRHRLPRQHRNAPLAHLIQHGQGVVRQRIAPYIDHQQLVAIQQRRDVPHGVVAQEEFPQRIEVQGRDVVYFVVVDMQVTHGSRSRQWSQRVDRVAAEFQFQEPQVAKGGYIRDGIVRRVKIPHSEGKRRHLRQRVSVQSKKSKPVHTGQRRPVFYHIVS